MSPVMRPVTPHDVKVSGEPRQYLMTRLPEMSPDIRNEGYDADIRQKGCRWSAPRLVNDCLHTLSRQSNRRPRHQSILSASELRVPYNRRYSTPPW
jgi:hypothetical protein